MTVAITTVVEARRRLADYLVQDHPLNLEEERTLLVCLDKLSRTADRILEYLGAQWYRLPTQLQLSANEFMAVLGK